MLRVSMGRTRTSIQERRAFFGCGMNTFFGEKPSKSQILQLPHYQGNATSVHGEYPRKARLFWVRHEHFFGEKPSKSQILQLPHYQGNATSVHGENQFQFRSSGLTRRGVFSSTMSLGVRLNADASYFD